MEEKNKRFNFTKEMGKGERFDFGKDSGLNRIKVELSWTKTKTPSGDWIDLDACSFSVGEDGILLNDGDFVYFKSESRWLPSDAKWLNPDTRENVDVTVGDFEPYDKSKYKNKKLWRRATIPVTTDGAVIGSPDDLGDSDDDIVDMAEETIHVILDKVHEDIQEIIFCVAVASEGVTFKDVKNPAISITDLVSGNELCRYNLKETFSTETAVEAGKLVIDDDGDWSFEAIGDGHDGGIATLADIYA